jgi:hypothetical protein
MVSRSSSDFPLVDFRRESRKGAEETLENLSVSASQKPA